MSAMRYVRDETISGDAERGNAVLKRIISLAPVTDEQQRFMYRTETMTPQDARDFITALAIHGMFVVATQPDAEPPPDAVAEMGGAV